MVEKADWARKRGEKQGWKSQAEQLVESVMQFVRGTGYTLGPPPRLNRSLTRPGSSRQTIESVFSHLYPSLAGSGRRA